MKDNRSISWIRDLLFTVIVVTVCSIVFGYFYDCYYDLNDDVLIKDILSGTYTGSPNARNIQMLYPIGLLISTCYRLVPELPWYGIFLCACHYVCMLLIGKRSISFVTGLLHKAVLLGAECILFMGLLMWEFTYVQYSVTCALLSATGVFLFCTTDDRLSPERFIRKNISSILLMILSFYIRSEMMLLTLPLVGAAVLFKWIEGTRYTGTRFCELHNLLKYLSCIIIILIGMGLGYISNEIAYSSNSWSKFMAFFDYRTELYDFQESPPEYEENVAYYEDIDLTQAQEQLLVNYNFALDDKIDEDVLSNIVNYNRVILAKAYFKNDIPSALRNYLYRVTHMDDAPWIYVVWMLYLMVLLTACMNHHGMIFARLFALVCMRSVSWMYLIMRGRMVARVYNSLYLVETLILLAFLFTECRDLAAPYRARRAKAIAAGEKRMPYRPTFLRIWPMTMACLLMAITIVPAVRAVSRIEEEQQRRSSVNAEWDELRDYFAENPQKFYFLDVFSTVAYSEKMFQDVDNSLRNYEICGGWAAKSPIYAAKLSNYGIHDIESDLMNMNTVYFVTRTDRPIEWLVEYYRSKGYEIRLGIEHCLMVDGESRFMVYRVRLHQKLETAR